MNMLDVIIENIESKVKEGAITLEQAYEVIDLAVEKYGLNESGKDEVVGDFEITDELLESCADVISAAYHDNAITLEEANELYDLLYYNPDEDHIDMVSEETKEEMIKKLTPEQREKYKAYLAQKEEAAKKEKEEKAKKRKKLIRNVALGALGAAAVGAGGYAAYSHFTDPEKQEEKNIKKTAKIMKKDNIDAANAELNRRVADRDYKNEYNKTFPSKYLGARINETLIDPARTRRDQLELSNQAKRDNLEIDRQAREAIAANRQGFENLRKMYAQGTAGQKKNPVSGLLDVLGGKGRLNKQARDYYLKNQQAAQTQ